MAEGPLNGVRILDLTHVWAGPLAMRIVADLGAEVVRVESPTSRGPRTYPALPIAGFVGRDPGDDPWNRNAALVKLMRNRRSVCVDLKDPAGRDLFLDLAAEADAVVENFSARAMPSLGLGWERLRERNPRLIYVTLSGFGTTGPYAHRVAFGPSVEPLTGLTTVMGYDDDELRNSAVGLLDPTSALTLTTALTQALRTRKETGAGTRIELSLYESGVAYSGPWLIDTQLGHPLRPLGNRHPRMSPHGVYPCAGNDQWLALACRDDDDWRALCGLLDNGLDPRWTLARRRAAAEAVDAVIAAWTGSRSRDTAVCLLRSAGVPAGAVNTAPDMLADPQARHRGYFVPLEAEMSVPGVPFRMQSCPAKDWTPSPNLGADNTAVLEDWLGYDAERVHALESAGTLATAPPE